MDECRPARGAIAAWVRGATSDHIDGVLERSIEMHDAVDHPQ